MRRARWLAPWKDSDEKPSIYHCISRVVERLLHGDRPYAQLHGDNCMGTVIFYPHRTVDRCGDIVSLDMRLVWLEICM
jgi:hypothetical protein